MTKRAITNDVKSKILFRIKNKLDISDLIKDYNIKGLDLCGAIITELDIHDEDVSNTNFTRCIIGQKGMRPDRSPWVNFNRSNISHCSFQDVVFPGTVWARRVRARNCKFTRAYMPYMDYRFADLSGSDFCDCIFSIGTNKGYGAYFSEDFFKDLSRAWGIEVRLKNKEIING